MAGLANLFYFGQPDPEQQIARMLSGQQQPGQQPSQGPPPPAAAPPSPGGGGADPNAPAAPAPAPPAPGNMPPNAGPQPQALQSSPDMAASYQQIANNPSIMSLYVQMDQRDRAMQGINSAFAQIAANHSPPSMRAAIMQGANAGAGDPSAIMGNLMGLYQNQQQMQAQQMLLAQAPAIAAKNNMDVGTVRAWIMAGRGGELLKSEEPTDMARNYNWAHQTYAANHPGASPDEIDAGAQAILLGSGGGGAVGSEMGAMNIARANYLRDPANAGKTPPGYMSDLGKWRIYQADLSDARTQFGGVNSSLDKFVGDMSDVANNPSLNKITGSTGGILTGAVEGLVPGEVNNLKTQMTGLAAEAHDMAQRGGPKGVNQNLKTLGSSPDDFTNASLTGYRDAVIAPRMRQALTAQANARGAAGMANAADTPGYLQHYMDKMYQPNGELDIGGAPKKVTPDTDANGKPLPPPDNTHMQDFWMALEHRGPQFALKSLKDAGFDTSSLR